MCGGDGPGLEPVDPLGGHRLPRPRVHVPRQDDRDAKPGDQHRGCSTIAMRRTSRRSGRRRGVSSGVWVAGITWVLPLTGPLAVRRAPQNSSLDAARAIGFPPIVRRDRQDVCRFTAATSPCRSPNTLERHFESLVTLYHLNGKVGPLNRLIIHELKRRVRESRRHVRVCGNPAAASRIRRQLFLQRAAIT